MVKKEIKKTTKACTQCGKTIATCNQCGEEMEYSLELEKWLIPVCLNPACPNFGLVQISREKIEEILLKESK